ncbi:DUF4352 domain-containing protein [Longivirga aurantiaca]|uniref:DUF4352 domain-containing protein n=1 Tax=Longivirga aurantiaca TaxID=1837743 RepID=A0ABW1T040_9ACTN
MSEQPPTYAVGQEVNGYRWTGTEWEPVAPAAAPVLTAPTAQPEARAKKPIWKRWWFWVLAVLLLFIIAGALGGGGGDKAATTTPSSTPTSSSPDSASEEPTESEPAEEPVDALPGLKTAVADGKFEFTATSLKCGVKSVGNEILGTKAQGQFCLIGITVKNIGDEAQILFDSNQVVFDKDGKKYESDTEAAIYANEDSSVFIEEINPGNSVKGILVFDVPKTVKPTLIEFHDSAFSGGVQVSLS